MQTVRPNGVRSSDWLGDVGNDIANGALWFRLLWLPVLVLLLIALGLLVSVVAEVASEDKERRRKRDQRPSEPHDAASLNVCLPGQ